MPLPEIVGPDRQKPLSYDPAREKFITYDELLSGAEKIVPVETLSHDDLKKLVIERNRRGPEYKMGSISGPTLERNDVISNIEADTELGRTVVMAEASYLSSLLKEIEDALPKGTR